MRRLTSSQTGHLSSAGLPHSTGPCSRDTRCQQPRSSTNMPSRERSLRVKDRMRVIRSSGSVRGGDGNTPAYSAECELDLAAIGKHWVGVVTIERRRSRADRDRPRACHRRHRPKADQFWYSLDQDRASAVVSSLRWRVATRPYRRTAGDHRKAARYGAT